MVNVFGLVYLWTLNMQASATAEVILDELDASRKELAEVKAKFEEVNDRKAAKQATRAAKFQPTTAPATAKLGGATTSRRIANGLDAESVQARHPCKTPLRSSRTTSPRR